MQFKKSLLNNNLTCKRGLVRLPRLLVNGLVIGTLNVRHGLGILKTRMQEQIDEQVPVVVQVERSREIAVDDVPRLLAIEGIRVALFQGVEGGFDNFLHGEFDRLLLIVEVRYDGGGVVVCRHVFELLGFDHHFSVATPKFTQNPIKL